MFIVIWVLKALWIILSETINIWRKLHKTKYFGMPPKFYHRVMYIAPSSGHEWLNLYLPFSLILRRFEVVFWCLEWECCTFWKIEGNSFKSTNTMALKVPRNPNACWLLLIRSDVYTTYRLTLGYKCVSYCTSWNFRVQLFSRFWPGAVIREWLISRFCWCCHYYNRHKLKWKFSRGLDSRNSRK